jgi:hypothetical protein
MECNSPSKEPSSFSAPPRVKLIVYYSLLTCLSATTRGTLIDPENPVIYRSLERAAFDGVIVPPVISAVYMIAEFPEPETRIALSACIYLWCCRNIPRGRAFKESSTRGAM